MKLYITTLCVAIALFLHTLSYIRQIKKTMREKKSSQISSTSFLYKIAKAIFAMIGLAIYDNYIGLGMESFMLVVYIISLWVIASYKPRGWGLFK